jgi:hypothetical protein
MRQPGREQRRAKLFVFELDSACDLLAPAPNMQQQRDGEPC